MSGNTPSRRYQQQVPLSSVPNTFNNYGTPIEFPVGNVNMDYSPYGNNFNLASNQFLNNLQIPSKKPYGVMSPYSSPVLLTPPIGMAGSSHNLAEKQIINKFINPQLTPLQSSAL